MEVLITNDIFFDILILEKEQSEWSLKHKHNFLTDEVIMNLKMWFNDTQFSKLVILITVLALYLLYLIITASANVSQNI